MYKCYTIHEKKFGERAGIENVIISKRKFQYEEEVKENPMNYDAWFDFIRLVESEGNLDLIRETYERAIANIPPSKEKHFWRRYIYLWINYAIFEVGYSSVTLTVSIVLLDMISSFISIEYSFRHIDINLVLFVLVRNVKLREDEIL